MDTRLELRALPHPDPRVRRAGFDLTSPYVEQCWGAVVGPSGVAILRRLPVLWSQQEPAVIPAGELARSVGLGNPHGDNSRFARALGRLCRFGFARWTDHGAALGVHAQVPPLSERHLARLPEWTQRAHDRLLGEHLDQLANPQQREPQEEQRRVGVAAIAGRRDALGGIQQRPPRRSPRGLALEP